MNAGTEILKKYKAHKWLSDDRKNVALPKDDQEWATNDWLLRTKAAGWKYWAVVQPENVIGHLNMQRAVKYNNERGVLTKVFSDPNEAMAWLESQ